MSVAELVPQPGRQAGRDPHSIPLDEIDVSDLELWTTDSHGGYFERLRKEDPVHYCAAGEFGPYWSVTRFEDIVHVEKNPEIFSSEPGIVILTPPPESVLQGAGFGSIDAQCVQGGSGGSDPSTPSSPQAGDVVKSMSPGAGKNVKRSQTVTLAVACT